MRKFLVLIFVCAGCLTRYEPPPSSQKLDALVVDGYVDVDGSASVQLSRTVPLDALYESPREPGATITIESSSGETFSLHEDSPGSYSASGLSVDKKEKYTLHVTTKDGHNYRSDAMQIYSTPPIDSIYYTISATDQLEIRADSHEINPDATGYYVTNAIETYEYHSVFYSGYKFVNKVAIERNPDEFIYYCWRDVQTSNVLTSTKNLTEKRLSGIGVSTIDRSSPKISIRYSVMVRQRAISEEEYTYQKQLLSSSEQQGSLFAQIPGTVLSNVYSETDKKEYVLGYFRAQEIKELRYFVAGDNDRKLPPGFYIIPGSDCPQEVTCQLGSPGRFDCIPVQALGDDTIITNIILDSRGTPTNYIFTRTDCGDCRVFGGTTKKPLFW